MNQTSKIVLTVFLTALLVGAGTYFLSNRAAQADKEELEAQVGELQVQVERLETDSQLLSEVRDQLSAEEGQTEQLSEEEVYEQAKDYCQSRLESQDSSLAGVVFVENDDGYFVECGISSGAAGAISIGKKIDGQWQKIWEGNGEIKQSIVDENKIPYSIHRGNTASDDQF